jgi:uncharacterized protein DUF5753
MTRSATWKPARGWVRNFQPGIIPGLLQTAEYARGIMVLPGIGDQAVDSLTTPGKHFALTKLGAELPF